MVVVRYSVYSSVNLQEENLVLSTDIMISLLSDIEPLTYTSI